MSLISPVKLQASPDVEKNILTWKSGFPNEYFEGDLSNWVITDVIENASMSIDDGKLLVDLPFGVVSSIYAINNYQAPKGDFETIIYVSDYLPDNYNDGFNVEFRITSNISTSNDYARILFFCNSPTIFTIFATIATDGVTRTNVTPNISTCPKKLKLRRIGTTFYIYYSIGSGWVLVTSYDCGSVALAIDNVMIWCHHRNSNGGSIRIDEFLVNPSNYYFSNDLCTKLDNWVVIENGATIIVDSEQFLLDVPSSDSSVQIYNNYSISQGDIEFSIDVLDYLADDVTHGPYLYMQFLNRSSDSDNYVIIEAKQTNTTNFSIRMIYNINDGGDIYKTPTVLTNMPSKFRIRRISNVLYVDYYNGSWNNFDSQDFGSYGLDLFIGGFKFGDNSTYGGSVKLDNCILDGGVDSYSIYWKKDKCPNCYFYNLDDWSFSSLEVGETASIENDTLLLDLPDSVNSQAILRYNNKMPSGDFVMTTDFLTYTPDASTGLNAVFRIGNFENTDLIYIQYWLNSSTHNIRSRAYINSEQTTVNTTSSNRPSKFKIERDGNYLKTYYYDDEWILVQSIDFSTRSELLDEIIYTLYSNSDRGGSCRFDNFIITPSVKDNYDGVINDIIDLTYEHSSLYPWNIYCYEVTSVNGSESISSEEAYSLPLLAPPDNVVVTPGIEKNIIIWDEALEAETYNIYWLFSSGVTKETGNKISGVTSPYEHISLTPGIPIYYVITSENENEESDESSEESGIPELASPTNPYAELTGALEITITWNAVLGATTYNIYWLKSPGVTKETGNKISGVTSPYIHSDLEDEDTYYYVITAENSSDESDISSEVSAVVGNAPIPPANVVAVSTDIQEITISWSSVGEADFYNIYYGVFSGINKIVGIKIEDVTSPYVFDAPIPDIQYYFLVTAVNDVTGEGDESETVNALSIPPIPDAPIDVVATPGEAKVRLDFTVAPYADTHHIYWSTTPGVTQLTGTKISDVSPGYEFIVPALYVPYYFVITAENESGESVDSVEVSATPIPVIPNIPENVEGEPTASGELTISWDIALYAETYNVYYSRLPNVDKDTATKVEGVADVEKAISDLIAGRLYYFAVAAVNPEGESELSEEAFARVINSLSGQQIFYIKAESEKNGIIISWSELEYADSYNLYWSKITPVSIATANKIENVSSPYRHYRLSTDDPYYVVTGENVLGESDPSPEAHANPDATDFQSINFLPENLHEYPLFQEFCNIVDYVVAKYHYENVDKLTGLYDAVHSDFDPNYVLGLLGSDYFLQFDLTDDQKKALCLLLSNLYDMKGTKKGLDYVLRLMGLDAQVYEWYNINQGLYPEIPEIVDPCSIVIDLGLGDHSLSDDTEQQFLNLASYLLWVCVKLHGIFWSKKFEDWFEGIEDELVTIEIDNSIYDKFCNYMYNYPETVIIGSPVMGSVTFIGESGLTIGSTYFEGYPFLISPDLEGGADTDGVCNAHFIGEPDIYIGGGDISQLTWVIEED